MKSSPCALVLPLLVSTTMVLTEVENPPYEQAEKDFAAAVQAAGAKDCPAELGRLESAVAAAPDDLRHASEYRLAVIACSEYERALVFFEKLTAAHPDSANALLNYGYAYVDKIPSAGAITRVILADRAVGLFSRSLERNRTWLALYTRGNSYLYWPTVFGRTPLAVADLEAAVVLSKTVEKRPYHVRAWVSLGDGYWKLDQMDKARATWQEGRKLFPDEARLAARLGANDEELQGIIEAELDSSQRVDTDLRAVWSEP